MLKSTKVVAGLGVIAAISVSSVPMASFAANRYEATGNVTLTAKIGSSISMKIDDKDPLVLNGDPEDPPYDETVDGNGITFNTNGFLSAGKGYTGDSKTTITMTTNYPTGYTLAAKGDNLDDSRISGKHYINAATSGVSITNDAAFAGETSGWGITVDLTSPSNGTMTGTYFGKESAGNYKMKTTSETIDSVTGITQSVEKKYTVAYGIGIAAGQASGTYTGTAHYVATQAE